MLFYQGLEFGETSGFFFIEKFGMDTKLISRYHLVTTQPQNGKAAPVTVNGFLKTLHFCISSTSI